MLGFLRKNPKNLPPPKLLPYKQGHIQRGGFVGQKNCFILVGKIHFTSLKKFLDTPLDTKYFKALFRKISAPQVEVLNQEVEANLEIKSKNTMFFTKFDN